MTQYHGGKQRLGKSIADIINNEIENDTTIQGYCEPFCGMLGVYQHVNNHPSMRYLAGDINGDLIEFWKSKSIPISTITKNEYLYLKSNPSRKAERGFYGFYNGFCGKYFSGFYCNPNPEKELCRFNNSINRIIDFHNKFPNIKFSTGNYTQYSLLKNYIIYCDPPYENTKQHYLEKFDSDKFYTWCECMSKNNSVFVSSYNMPEKYNWKIVYEKHVNTTCGTHVVDNSRIERLYKV